METTSKVTLPDFGTDEAVDYLIVMNLDRASVPTVIPADSLSWVMIDCKSGVTLCQKEVHFVNSDVKRSIGNDVVSFSNAISDIQDRYQNEKMCACPNSYVVLPDKDTALLLRDCFLKLGLRLPSFLFRVYLLYMEFSLFSARSSIRYPVANSMDFILRVCNGQDPSYRGINRCLDVQSALFSLLQKGHCLHPSSLCILYGNDEQSSLWSTEGNRRHQSMDATEGSLRHGSVSQQSYSSIGSSLSFYSPALNPNMYLSDGRSLRDGLFSRSVIHSHTPLLGASPFIDTRHLSSEDYMPELQLTSRSDDYRLHDLFTFHEEAGADSPSFPPKLPTRSVTSLHTNEPITFSISTTASKPLWQDGPYTDSIGKSLFSPSWSPTDQNNSMEAPSTLGQMGSLTRNSTDLSTSRTLYGGMSQTDGGMMHQRTENEMSNDERRRANSISFVPSAGLRYSQPSPLSLQCASTPLFPSLSQHPSRPSMFTIPGSYGFHDNDSLNDFSLNRPDSSSEVSGFDISRASTEMRASSDYKLDDGMSMRSMEFYNNNSNRIAYRNESQRLRSGSNSFFGMNPHCAEFVPNNHQSVVAPVTNSVVRDKKSRELLEETMLIQRIEENDILTLKLRGLPYTATKEDIIEFFSPLVISMSADGTPVIVIGQDNLQRPSGEAFVTFSSVQDCVEGLKYHMRHLGKRYIEIFPLFNKEYYRKNSIYCSICNKYGHTSDACLLRFQGHKE